jgi:hypothetical protein
MVSDGKGRPLSFFLSLGQMSDAKGALVLLAQLPPAKRLLGDKRLYKKRCRIENAFARLKDWRGIGMRYTRCGDLFLSAIVLAAAVIFWMRQRVWS